MQPNEIASLALVVVGLVLNITNQTKSIVPKLRLSTHGIWYIPLLVILVVLVGPMLTLLVFLIIYYNNRQLILVADEIYLITGIFAGSLLSTIRFWPYLFLLSYASNILLPNSSQQQNVIELQNSQGSDILVKIILACIFAPIVEEILFRKFLYPLLKKYIGIFWGAVSSSLLFSAIHYNVLSFALLFLFSMFLTYLYERHASLMKVILSHSIFNILMTILILLN